MNQINILIVFSLLIYKIEAGIVDQILEQSGTVNRMTGSLREAGEKVSVDKTVNKVPFGSFMPFDPSSFMNFGSSVDKIVSKALKHQRGLENEALSVVKDLGPNAENLAMKTLPMPISMVDIGKTINIGAILDDASTVQKSVPLEELVKQVPDTIDGADKMLDNIEVSGAIPVPLNRGAGGREGISKSSRKF